MARPTFKIVESATHPSTGYTQAVQVVDAIWHLTYRGELAKVRQDASQSGGGFKYIRSSWANEQTGWTQVEKYRRLYGTDDFGLIEIRPKQRTYKHPR
tara:strand:- start:160 stop:453 length:294 start_codon:yes stop_codon:yes gene_type:complete